MKDLQLKRRSPFKWLLLIIVTILLGGGIYLASWEVLTYSTRSLGKAREDAQKTFIMVCAREGLHTSDFAGPKRLEGKNVPFSFLWNMRDDPRKTIEVDVTYLPYDLEYYFSEDLAKEKP
jgi:hypothetical protein